MSPLRSLIKLVLATILMLSLVPLPIGADEGTKRTPPIESTNDEPPHLKPLLSGTPSTVGVKWDVIKEQILRMKALKNPVWEDVLSRSEHPGEDEELLSISWCQSLGTNSTTCQGIGKAYAPDTLERRNAGVAVADRGERLFVYFEYLEARHCRCIKEELVKDVFPVILLADIAKSCSAPEGKVNQGYQVVADEGKNATAILKYEPDQEGGDLQMVMIVKGFGKPHPLEIYFKKRTTNPLVYEDSEDWQRRALSFTFDKYVVLRLQNVRRSDQGIYIWYLSFMSKSCISFMELRLSDIDKNRCRPRPVSIDWPTIQQKINATGSSLAPWVLGANISRSLRIQRCPSKPGLCGTASHRCVSSDRRIKRVSLPLPDNNACGKSDLAINLVEDEKCLCNVKDAFMPEFFSETPLLNITKVEKVHTCAEICQPHYVKIPWRELRRQIVRYSYLSLPSNIIGKKIRVKRCHKRKSPCRQQPNTFCDVVAEKKSSKKIKLSINSKIKIKYYEDSKCECKTLDKLTYDVKSKKFKPPTITYIDLKELP